MKIALYTNSKRVDLSDNLVWAGKDLFVYLSDKKVDGIFDYASRIAKYMTISSLSGFGDWLFFTLFAPLIWFTSLTRALFVRMKGVKVVILTNLADKLMYTVWLRMVGVRVVWVESTLYDKNFTSNIYILLFGLLSRLAVVATISHAVTKHLVAHCYVKESRCVYYGTSIDIESTKTQSDLYDSMVAIQQEIKNPNLFVVGYMGDIGNDSGVETLVKAVESIREFIVDMSVIVVGDGSQKKNIMWLTKMLGLENVISFVGKQQQWMRWYNYFDVFVCPTQKKTEFSFETAYALAHGVPTIVTSIDGVEEVSAYQSGYLVAPGASHDLGQAILDIFNNKPQRESFGKQGKKRAYDEYSREVVGERLRRVVLGNS